MIWTLLASTLYAALLSSAACTPAQVSGLMGGSVLLKAEIPPGFHVRETFWKSLTPLDELVATSFTGARVTQYRSRFYGRCQLHNNFTLEISPVGLGDAGTFLVLLVNISGEMEEQVFHLAVYDVVSTPAIRVFAEERRPNASGASCVLFLTCTASAGSNVTYSWTGPEGKTLAREKHTVFGNGQVLWAKLDLLEEQQESYTCTAANTVSKGSVTVHVQEYCQRQPVGKDPLYDYRDVLLIIIPLASLLLLAGTVLIMHCKRRSGKKTAYTISENEPIPV
ncbi:SLAM family member 8 [Elgaria multicarinata webbii]|uniref:SLAM family member 8 n=1 Tax=Elgaria multicarinata webbii TaxID=159646 RepID=UPI002FCD45DD